MTTIEELVSIVYDNEETVREEFITPLLKMLGYTSKTNNYHGEIHRGFSIKNPFFHGKEKICPKKSDYIIEIEDFFVLVIEAKHPKENIQDTKHLGQAFSYAYCPQIEAEYFLLTNAHTTNIYNTKKYQRFFKNNYTPDCSVLLKNLKKDFHKLNRIISKRALLKAAKIKKRYQLLNRIDNFEGNESVTISIKSYSTINGQMTFDFELEAIENIFFNGMWFRLIFYENDISYEIGEFEISEKDILLKRNSTFVKITNFEKANEVIDFFETETVKADMLFAKPYIPNNLLEFNKLINSKE